MSEDYVDLIDYHHQTVCWTVGVLPGAYQHVAEPQVLGVTEPVRIPVRQLQVEHYVALRCTCVRHHERT